MLVSKKVIEEIYHNADEDKIKKVKELINDDMIKIIKATYDDGSNFEIYSKVKDFTETHDIYAKIQKDKIAKVSCSCGECTSADNVCAHVIASVDRFDNSKEYTNIFGLNSKDKGNDNRLYDKANQYKTFNQIISAFYEEMREKDEKIKGSKKTSNALIGIKAKIVYNSADKEMSAEFKINDGKSHFKLKNLIEFYDNFLDGGIHKYGQKIEFRHTRDMVKEEDQKLLDFILKYSEIMKYTNESLGQQRYLGKVMNEGEITISNTCLDIFLPF